MTFQQTLDKYDLADIEARIEAMRPADVEAALAAAHLGIDDFMALLSPAAAGYLEPMAQRAHRLTVQRFGKTILMYAPLYLSNECTNGCRYCGFNAHNQVPRRTLNLDEIEAEARVLHDRGFRHLLLVTGEAPKAADTDYLAAAVARIRPLFSSMSIEVYPMDEAGYRQVIAAGVDGLTLYQETYDRDLYAEMHPFGKKRDFDLSPARPRTRRGRRHAPHRHRRPARPGQVPRRGLLHRPARPAPGPPLLAHPSDRLLPAHAPGGRRLPAASPGLRPRLRPADLRAAPAAPRCRAGPLHPGECPAARQPAPLGDHPDERRLLHLPRWLCGKGRERPAVRHRRRPHPGRGRRHAALHAATTRSGKTGIRPFTADETPLRRSLS